MISLIIVVVEYLIAKSITIASNEAKNLYEDRAIGERKKIARNCR